MTVYVGSARIDERGKATGGKAGDQSGKELSIQKWYKHSGGGWTSVIHIIDPVKRKKYRDFIKWACNSSLIGYDQYERTTLYKAIKALGFENYKKLNKKVECDCSSLVACGLIVAGIDVPCNWRTGTLEGICKESKYKGILAVYTSSSYTNATSKLYDGDIINKRYSHVVTVISGAKGFESAKLTYNANVKAFQKAFNSDFYDEIKAGKIDELEEDGLCGTHTKAAIDKVMLKSLDKKHPEITKLVQKIVGFTGNAIDGKYGPKTKAAVEKYQKAHGLTADGEVGPKTLTKLLS